MRQLVEHDPVFKSHLEIIMCPAKKIFLDTTPGLQIDRHRRNIKVSLFAEVSGYMRASTYPFHLPNLTSLYLVPPIMFFEFFESNHLALYCR